MVTMSTSEDNGNGVTATTATTTTNNVNGSRSNTPGTASPLTARRTSMALKKKHELEEELKLKKEREKAKTKENKHFYVVGDKETANAVGVLNSDFCNACHDGGDLLCCESCDASFHLMCVDPPLQSIPDGDWYCNSCSNQRTPKPKGYYGKNIFTPLFKTLDTINPLCFHLPESYLLNNTMTQTFCDICETDDNIEDILRCSQPKCTNSAHTYCLDPPLLKKPLTWKCELHEDKKQKKQQHQNSQVSIPSSPENQSSFNSYFEHNNALFSDSNQNKRINSAPFLTDRFTLEFGSNIHQQDPLKIFQNRYNPSYTDPFYENIYGNGLSVKDYYDHQLILDLFGKDNVNVLTNNNSNGNNKKTPTTIPNENRQRYFKKQQHQNEDQDDEDDSNNNNTNRESLNRLEQLLFEQRRLSVAAMPSEFGIYPNDLSNHPIDNCNEFVLSSLSPLFTQFLAWQRLMQINNQIFQLRAGYRSKDDPLVPLSNSNNNNTNNDDSDDNNNNKNNGTSNHSNMNGITRSSSHNNSNGISSKSKSNTTSTTTNAQKTVKKKSTPTPKPQQQQLPQQPTSTNFMKKKKSVQPTVAPAETNDQMAIDVLNNDEETVKNQSNNSPINDITEEKTIQRLSKRQKRDSTAPNTPTPVVVDTTPTISPVSSPLPTRKLSQKEKQLQQLQQLQQRQRQVNQALEDEDIQQDKKENNINQQEQEKPLQIPEKEKEKEQEEQSIPPQPLSTPAVPVVPAIITENSEVETQSSQPASQENVNTNITPQKSTMSPNRTFKFKLSSQKQHVPQSPQLTKSNEDIIAMELESTTTITTTTTTTTTNNNQTVLPLIPDPNTSTTSTTTTTTTNESNNNNNNQSTEGPNQENSKKKLIKSLIKSIEPIGNFVCEINGDDGKVNSITVPISDKCTVIGRGHDKAIGIKLQSKFVSHLHAIIEVLPSNELYFTNFGKNAKSISINGNNLNTLTTTKGTTIHPGYLSFKVENGDIIEIFDNIIKLNLD